MKSYFISVKEKQHHAVITTNTLKLHETFLNILERAGLKNWTEYQE